MGKGRGSGSGEGEGGEWWYRGRGSGGTETLVVQLWRPWERQQQWGTGQFEKGLQPKI